jgi:hypothetical protein
MAGSYLQVIVPRASAVLDSPGETSCGIHADHISICKYPSTYSPQYGVAATNISRMIQIINLVFSPDYSTQAAALDALALLLYGDEVGVQKARASVLEKAKNKYAVGCDHVQLGESMWHEQLIGGVESLNLPADMRTLFMA